ncbi:MAG: hypothetical protein HYV19_03465 [Gemmatimonadetes bacterium]|nr:hypothetical protein [Gemmatimonadota bacterium]
MKHRIALLASLAVLAACGEAPTESAAPTETAILSAKPLGNLVFTSGADVRTWDPITPSVAYDNWPATVCTNTPLVGLDANWQNEHNAFVVTGHPWAFSYFFAPWIASWNGTASVGPNGHNWTKFRTQVTGNGSFVIRLLADNCSWIYLDRTLVGVQGNDLSKNSYGLTLNGTHTLEFIIFDGGGAAGGKFMLETTTNPPPPLNNDLDNDGHVNDADAFPLDPTRWEPEVVDATPPTITPTVTGTMGANGWYTSDVDVSWAVADAESDIGSTSGCDAVTVSSDTNGASFTCSATSVGGTASQTVTVKRDATKPAIGYSGNAGSYTVDQDVAISCTASDAMSGLASSTCANVAGAAYTFASGLNSFSASAQDNAGNANAASASFMVSATSGSVCSLVERWVSNVGVANSMCVKLRHGSYGAFRNELSAQSGKKISAANAAILLRLVNLLG